MRRSEGGGGGGYELWAIVTMSVRCDEESLSSDPQMTTRKLTGCPKERYRERGGGRGYQRRDGLALEYPAGIGLPRWLGTPSGGAGAVGA
jgi:hypothetical protein